MATMASSSRSRAAKEAQAALTPAQVDSFAFIARQPIYDSGMAVVAFELLYKPLDAASPGVKRDPGQAALRAISGAALEIGLDKLAGGLPVHIHFPRELLVDVPQLPFPAERVVVEVHEEALAEPQALVADGILS